MSRQAKVLTLSKDWWLAERKPAQELIIQKKKALAAKYFKIKEVSERLNVSVDVLYDEIRSGRLEAERIGEQYRVSEEALLDYLAKQKFRKQRRSS
jgi:excisionase family DNA binding protein